MKGERRMTTSRHDSDKRVVRTKKAIKGALFRLLQTKDISDITISELTAEAGVNRRTFYTHYANLTDILDEIDAELSVALTSLSGAFEKSDCKRGAYDFFIGLNKIISVDFDYYFKLVSLDFHGTITNRIKTVIRSSALSVISQLSEKHGAEVAGAYAFVAGGFFNAYLDWRMSKQEYPLERAAEITSALVSACLSEIPEIISK